MRHLVLLACVYALVLPGSLAASDEPVPPAAPETSATATTEAAPPPTAPEAAPTPPAAPPAQPSAASAPTPVPPPATPAPAEQQPATTPAPAGQPAEQDLGDERDPQRPKPRRVVATAAASKTVTIADFAFSPSSITINVGDTVTWRNTDNVAHSATAEEGSFDTGTFAKGESRSETFDTAGTFQYICTPHPFMKGTVTVNAASSGGSGSGDTGSDAGGTNSDSGSSSSSGSSSGSGSTSGSSASGSSSGSSSDSGSALPNTGADAANLAILGLLMLALGAVVQRRATSEG